VVAFWFSFSNSVCSVDGRFLALASRATF
jgi:hypothetical protein